VQSPATVVQKQIIESPIESQKPPVADTTKTDQGDDQSEADSQHKGVRPELDEQAPVGSEADSVPSIDPPTNDA
jgi:hypothetical protein